LLREDGVIFISIDDNEVHNLRHLCDEVFGEGSFVAQICHKARASISNDKIISSNHNHILLYAKNYEIIFANRDKFGISPTLEGFDKKDEKGFYKLTPVDGPGGERKGNPFYEFLGVKGYFRYSKKAMEEMYKKGLIVKIGNSLQKKYYLEEAKEKRKTITTWWDEKLYTSTATSRLKQLMEGDYFTNPKPIELIKRMLELSTSKNDIILDFFSGSATTAHAVMELNAEDGGNRQFIMVQIPEKVDEKSEAYKAGFRTIAEIGRERIIRAAKKIKKDFKDKEYIDKLDFGFRYFKVDSSNFKDAKEIGEIIQENLFDTVDNIKPDRDDLDLLFEVILFLGLELTLQIETKEILGKRVYFVEYNSLIACFDDEIDENLAKELASYEPLKVVLRDSSFKTDSDKINFEETIKELSPDTDIWMV